MLWFLILLAVFLSFSWKVLFFFFSSISFLYLFLNCIPFACSKGRKAKKTGGLFDPSSGEEDAGAEDEEEPEEKAKKVNEQSPKVVFSS